MSSYANFQEDPTPSPPQKSGSGLKWVLIILGVGGLLCVLACGGLMVGTVVLVRKTVSDDPATVRQIASEITEINVPDGYEPIMSMNIVFKMAVFGNQNQQSPRALVLMKFPKNMGDEDEMRSEMQRSLDQQGGNQHNFSEMETETRTYTIRGEECAVTVTKMRAEDDTEVRQCTAVFAAKDGAPAMLMFMMPEEEWQDGGEADFETMLESME